MTLNLPNILTLSRVPLMFIVVGLMYADFPWCDTLAFWLFIAAALTDWLDGKIARERGIVSSFGRFMDSVLDKVLVIGLMIALVNGDYFAGYSLAAMLLLLCILCREFAAGGKVKTFVQLNAIGWLMGARMLSQDYPELFSGDGRDWVIGVRALGMFLFVLSAILTVWSGISYFRRYGRVLSS